MRNGRVRYKRSYGTQPQLKHLTSLIMKTKWQHVVSGSNSSVVDSLTVNITIGHFPYEVE